MGEEAPSGEYDATAKQMKKEKSAFHDGQRIFQGKLTARAQGSKERVEGNPFSLTRVLGIRYRAGQHRIRGRNKE